MLDSGHNFRGMLIPIVTSRTPLCIFCSNKLLQASWNTSVSAHAVSISKGLGKSVAGYYHTAGKSTEQFVKHKISPPRRALLYVPGHDERKIKKVTDLHVDCVALDCEDGVAFSK